MSHSYNLSQISDILHAPLRGGRQASATTQPQVTILLTDSRSLTFANHTLFFALVTKTGDGHKYIPYLYAQGVRAFVISQEFDTYQKICPEAWFIRVPNTLQALQQLAAYHRSLFSIPVVGITGSNGKTIVKEWLYQLLHDTRSIVRSPRSYNSQVGVPLSVWQLNDTCNFAIFEAGISKPNEMEALEPVIRPTIGILTNLGHAHQENFESSQQKLIEKLQLFKNCDIVIYNADIEGIADAMEISGIGARSMSWTTKHKDAQVEILSVKRDDHSTTVQYLFLGMSESVTIPMTDEASFENAMNCLSLLLLIGMHPEEIAKKMSHLSPLAMRLEVMEGVRNSMIINDVYNSDLTSLSIALDFMKRRDTSLQKKSLILSDMVETGLSPEQLCQQIAQLCGLHNLYRFVGIGAALSEYRNYFSNIAQVSSFYDSTAAFLASGELDDVKEELVLIKGSRMYHLEQVSEVLQLRRHETILEVNLDAIVHNLNRYRSLIKPETKLVCMIKAFGYGTGSYELAKTLQDNHVDYLAVAVADEGAELRRQGITTRIMVMNPEFSAFRTIINNRLEPEVYSFRMLDAFVAECQKLGVANYPIHIKIDSGMHRLGFQRPEIEKLIERVKHQNCVTIRSVFSHLAGADEAQFDAFTEEQVRRFRDCADLIVSSFPHHIIRHILNTAGMERFPQYQFEMCRLGIGLYGVEPSFVDNELETVASLKTTILQIKDIPDTETVGYSRKGKLSRNSRIGMIPIGYADGFNRRLGNGHSYVLVHGVKCPTVGNVCMDVAFIDLTECPQAKEGDSVLLFGKELPVTVISDILDTIPYEVLTSISRRVNRIYYKE